MVLLSRSRVQLILEEALSLSSSRGFSYLGAKEGGGAA